MTLRSTEKRLTLLAFSKLAGVKVPRATRSKVYDNAFSQRSKRKYTTNNYFRGPRIKCQEVSEQKVLFSTSVPQPVEVPFLNPNKPNPEKAKSVALKPIVPLTQSRFPQKVSSEIPSVTKVLSATTPAESQFILDRWKEGMIKKLGAAGFAKYQAETFQRGHALHALLAKHLLGKGEPTTGSSELSTEIVSNLWKSIQNVVREKISNVRLVEHIVTHPSMKYRGIVDCVAFYENELVVIDFKTAEKPKKTIESLYDNPLQVTAYCGAINNDSNIPRHVIDRNINAGLVIVAYIDGSEASTYYFGCEEVSNNYWKQWSARLDQYVRMEAMNKKTGNNN